MQNWHTHTNKQATQKSHNQVVFNLYGDVGQHIEDEKGFDSWDEVKEIADFEIQELNENYRNAHQITEYCNDLFGMNMQAINLEGSGVHKILSHDDFGKRIVELFSETITSGLCAIIVRTREEAKAVLNKASGVRTHIHNMVSGINDIDTEKWNLMTVKQARGLEFNKVLAISGQMSKNEKYITYTRALDELFVYDQEIS